MRYMRREWRGSMTRFLFFVGCLAVGVAAIVAVSGLSHALDQGIRRQARELLAADVAVSGLRPLPESLETYIAGRPDLERSTVREMVTVVALPAQGEVPGASQIVELKVVDGAYPFYGELQLDPELSQSEALDERGVIVAPDLLTRLGIGLGDELLVGGESFVVRAAVLDEPDRIGSAFTLGPRAFLSPDGLERAGLERFGSRISYRTLLALPDAENRDEIEALAEDLRELLPATRTHRVETYAEAQPALRQGIGRADRFLGLAALLSLLIGGVGVSQTVRSWLSGRLDAIAVLRCLGFRPREVLTLYFGQATFLGLAGSIAGAVSGTLVLALVPHLLGDLLPDVEIAVVQPAAILRGVVLGVGVALIFAFGPLLTSGSVPPLRVLRRDVEPPRPRTAQRLAIASLIVVGILAAASIQSESLERGLQFTLGVGIATAVLAGAALIGVGLIGRFPLRNVRPWLRNGLRALVRPGAATLGAVTALGLGVLFVVGMGLVERVLAGELSAQIPEDSPTAFLIDIQPDQWIPVKELLESHGAGAVESVPVVTARLAAIDGRDVEELVDETEPGGRRWALTREQRLTYGRELPEDNRVVEGALWSRNDVGEISVEEEFARDLGLSVGSVVRFDIQGTDVDLTVTSLRSVDWRTFGINFFLVAEPGVLESAPQVRLAVARLSRGDEQRVQNALAARFPNVTLIKTREVLEKVGTVLGRLAEAIRFLGGFTVAAGIVILAGVVSSTAVRRGREIALLKTLGSTRAEIVRMFVVEHALLGLVAGGMGAVGGALLAFMVVTRGFELAYRWDLGYVALATVATVVLTALTALAAGGGALRRRPMEVLRAE
jgi:putative ABC transport system permease protein